MFELFRLFLIRVGIRIVLPGEVHTSLTVVGDSNLRATLALLFSEVVSGAGFRSVLVTGAPGTGKTFCVQSLVKEKQCALIVVDCTKAWRWLGLMRLAVQVTKGPLIVHFDQADSLSSFPKTGLELWLIALRIASRHDVLAVFESNILEKAPVAEEGAESPVFHAVAHTEPLSPADAYQLLKQVTSGKDWQDAPEFQLVWVADRLVQLSAVSFVALARHTVARAASTGEQPDLSLLWALALEHYAELRQ